MRNDTAILVFNLIVCLAGFLLTKRLFKKIITRALVWIILCSVLTLVEYKPLLNSMEKVYVDVTSREQLSGLKIREAQQKILENQRKTTSAP